MASSVKVAVRVRPRNQREIDLDSNCIIQMTGKKTSITNCKLPTQSSGGDNGRERIKDFTFDYSYWTVNPTEANYASQGQVFSDLGMDVIHNAYEGYNACVFAYGQTGSGKTYTMMGTPNDEGLTPKFCKELFKRMNDSRVTYRTEVSYLEIYNERVRDLLKGKTQHTLRVREHPKDGPYVQDLSKHLVMNYEDIKELIDKGNSTRTTASTNMNDSSSRSHAIFTMVFTQAKFSKDSPSEKHSKIHLVDLAGSERASATGATGQRLKEGGSINKSLVTLGNVISTLADMADKSGKNAFIPYRDSVLTWLLKDSLGGNAKTIMIATISPAQCNYGESLSTLRYANRAKNIINKPTVNEDPNVKLIRDLRREISRLKALLGGNIDKLATPRVQEKLHENEARVKVMTEMWQGQWQETAGILEERELALRKEGLGVMLDSELPHLIGIDDDLLSTGIMLYHLKDRNTTIGTSDAEPKQDIKLSGVCVEPRHCEFINHDGEVTLVPIGDALCTVNGTQINEPTQLTQGAVILLGKTNMFRFNHPAQAAMLRKESKTSLSLSRGSLLSQSMTDLYKSTDNLHNLISGPDMEQKHREQLELLEAKRLQIEEMEEKYRQAETDRASEQTTREQQLEHKRKQIEDMQLDATKIKQEAQQVQMEVQKEKDNLKRRSLNLEKQLELYSKEIGHSDEFDGSALDSGMEIDESADLGKQLQVLLARERFLRQKTEDQREQLEQDLLEKEKQIRNIQEDLKADRSELQKQEQDVEEQLQQLKQQVQQGDTLHQQRLTEMQLAEKERAHLRGMREDHRLFQHFQDELSDSCRERLQAENERLSAAQQSVTCQEKSMYEVYKQEEQRIKQKKVEMMAEVEQRRQQLESDKVYLEECEEQVQAALNAAKYGTEAEREAAQREYRGVQAERQRMEEEERDIEELKDRAESEEVCAQQALIQLRTQQVEQLNQKKSELRTLHDIWESSVNKEISRAGKRFEDTKCELDKQSVWLEKKKRLEETISNMEEDKEEIAKAWDYVSEGESKQEREMTEAKMAVQHALNHLQTSTDNDLLRIQCQKEKLEHLSKEERSSRRDGCSPPEDDELFNVYRQQAEAELEHQQAELTRTRNEQLEEMKQCQAALDEERMCLNKKTKELSALEEQLRASEAELSEKSRAYEAQRQQEQDSLHFAKLQLQEMEQQEQMNQLVESEVQKRLLEQRVQREKEVLMEREERDSQIAKIRKTHQREMQNLRQKYEATRILENTPTRANPYASVLSGSVTPGSLSRSNSRKNIRATSPSSRSSPSPSEPPTTVSISVPSYVQRGSGFDSHFEYQVKVIVGEDSWTVFRRYSKFRELHADLKKKYKEVAVLVFPPKKFFGNNTERVVSERRSHLEDYLQNLLHITQNVTLTSPLHRSRVKGYSKQQICDFHPFFKKGVFEPSSHGTA